MKIALPPWNAAGITGAIFGDVFCSQLFEYALFSKE